MTSDDQITEDEKEGYVDEFDVSLTIYGSPTITCPFHHDHWILEISMYDIKKNFTFMVGVETSTQDCWNTERRKTTSV